MEGARRNPRAQKHREAERRHREKLAENLDALRSMLPGASTREQKAEIFAKAVDYIQYLRSQVPPDKWFPPPGTYGFYGDVEPSEGDTQDDVEAAYLAPGAPSPYMMQGSVPGGYPPPGFPPGAPPPVAQMGATLSLGPLHAPMYVYLPDGRAVPALQHFPYGSVPIPIPPQACAGEEDTATEESFDVSRKRKHAEASPVLARSGTADSGTAIAVDGTASGSLKRALQAAKTEFPLGAAEADSFVQRSSNRRRRRVEDAEASASESPDTRQTETVASEATFLDALASVAASSQPDYGSGRVSLAEVPVGRDAYVHGFPGRPDPHVGYPSETMRAMESFSMMTLSRDHGMPARFVPALEPHAVGMEPSQRYPVPVVMPSYDGGHPGQPQPFAAARGPRPTLPKIQQTHARMGLFSQHGVADGPDDVDAPAPGSARGGSRYHGRP